MAIFDYIEAEIGDKDFLLRNQFSIADIATTCQFVQMMYSREPLPEASHPNVTHYIKANLQRPSFKTLINADPFMTVD